jgi:hypothetical protein
MTKEQYKLLIKQGQELSVEIQSREYSPVDDLAIKNIRDWNISIIKQYSNMNFEEQQSLFGLSRIISGTLEDNKTVYYAVKNKELLEKIETMRKND